MSKGEYQKCECGNDAVVMWPISGTSPKQYRHYCMKCYNKRVDGLTQDIKTKKGRAKKCS